MGHAFGEQPKMIQFAASVSFVVPTASNQFGKRVVDTKTIRNFWENVGSVTNKRSSYVFSLRAGRGERPWYVGKAARQVFQKECFTPDKLSKFNPVLSKRKGTPLLRFVFHKKSGRGKWATKAIHELEGYLIGLAYARNSSLLNRQRLPRQKWYISRVVASGKGRPSHGSASLKGLLGVA